MDMEKAERWKETALSGEEVGWWWSCSFQRIIVCEYYLLFVARGPYQAPL